MFFRCQLDQSTKLLTARIAATGKVITKVSVGTKKDVDLAVQAAKKVRIIAKYGGSARTECQQAWAVWKFGLHLFHFLIFLEHLQ